MKKIKSVLCTVGILFFMTILGANIKSLPIHAATTSETESNDTVDTANAILENKSTAAGYLSGNDQNQHVVTGYTSSTDEDWFKVYLSSGKKYMTCNTDNYGKGFEYQIYATSDFTYIDSQIYVKNEYGPVAKKIDVPSSGYYYIRIQGQNAISNSYLFAIGNPTFSSSSCVIKCEEESVTMDEKIVTANFNGSQLEDVPDSAIAYTIMMDGLKSTSVDSINILNKKSNKSCSLQRYTWQKTGLVSLNMNVRSDWVATFTKYKTVTFSPSLKVYYVYPVIDTVIENN